MARSFKKQPVSGNACAASEKKDKQRAHRVARASFRLAAHAATPDGDVVFEERNEAHSNVWSHAKDGKHWMQLRVARLGRAVRVISAPRWVQDARHAHKLLAK